MRFTVTGGAGFIGSHLVEHLVNAGHEVTVLDNLSTGRLENLAPWLGRIRFLEGSVTDALACAVAVRGADYVLHQAALPSVPRSVANPAATHEACATGTMNVLLAARDAGVRRVVYAASSSAYGDTPELPKREEMMARPRSPYAAAKLAGELYCRAFHTSFGLPTVALRYFNVFGPRQDPASEYAAVIPRFIVAAMTGRSPLINGDGWQTRDFTYVDNVVQANLLACHAPEAAFGEVVNVGGGRRTSVNELWLQIRALLGSEVQATYVAAGPSEVRDSLASLERARQLLGYEPRVSFEDGLQATVQYFAGAQIALSA